MNDLLSATPVNNRRTAFASQQCEVLWAVQLIAAVQTIRPVLPFGASRESLIIEMRRSDIPVVACGSKRRLPDPGPLPSPSPSPSTGGP